MRTRIFFRFICLVFAAGGMSLQGLYGWGGTGHKIINANAILCLPEELRPFYIKHKSVVVEESVTPDVWRKADPDEKFRHFINLDKLEPYPFSSFPMNREDAIRRFGQVRLGYGGTLPWRVEEFCDKLAKAFAGGDARAIAEISGWLGHYVADGCQPLHVTKKFDGEKKRNAGLHLRYEDEMVYRHRKELGAFPEGVEAAPVTDVLDTLFRLYREGFREAPGLSKADDAAKKAARSYNDAYYAELYRLTGGMTKERMDQASRALASLWLSAWIRAGRPALPQTP